MKQRVSNEPTNVRLMYAEHRACLEHACDLITNLRLIDIRYYLITHYFQQCGDIDHFDRFENFLLVSFSILYVVFVCARVFVCVCLFM